MGWNGVRLEKNQTTIRNPFHDDDLYDCGWGTDFSFTVPTTKERCLRAKLNDEHENEEMIPFFVTAKKVASITNLCFDTQLYLYRICQYCQRKYKSGNAGTYGKMVCKSMDYRQISPIWTVHSTTIIPMVGNKFTHPEGVLS